MRPDAQASPHAQNGPASGVRTQRRRVTGRAVLGLVAVIAVLAGAYFVPLPSIGQARDWSESLGPWFPWLFFVVYTVVTIGPIPRSTFTVMSGVLFGPVIGFTGSLAAATVSAVVAFWLARRLGRDRVQPWLSKPVVATVEARLERRGWLAVGSLRLIPAVPFSLVNYLSGLSSIRVVPYLIATVLGSAPGTAAVVFLGDALTGKANPVMIAMSGCLFTIGVIGLIVDARIPVTDHHNQASQLD